LYVIYDAEIRDFSGLQRADGFGSRLGASFLGYYAATAKKHMPIFMCNHVVDVDSALERHRKYEVAVMTS
jgi:hypothetical protein